MEATKVLESLKSEKIKFKNDNIAEPDMYLGARLQKKQINGKDAWTITSVDYIKAAIDTIRGSIKGTRWKISGIAKTPMQSSFVPELDQTPELIADDTILY